MALLQILPAVVLTPPLPLVAVGLVLSPALMDVGGTVILVELWIGLVLGACELLPSRLCVRPFADPTVSAGLCTAGVLEGELGVAEGLIWVALANPMMVGAV